MLQSLNVALGLAFVFMLFSMVVSTASELVFSRANLRGKTLWRALANMLPGATTTASSPVLEAFVQHPLVKVLHLRQDAGDADSVRRSFPSYIPSWQFSQIMLDILETAGAAAGKGETRWEQLRAGIATLPAPSGEPLQALARDADRNLLPGQDPLGVFQSRLAQWYDASMDRTSGWYKRVVQAFNFGLGFVLAAACNLNTIEMVRGLSMDDGLRKAFADRAAALVVNAPPPPATSPAAPSLPALNSSADAAAAPLPAPQPVDAGAYRQALNTALDEFAKAGFPLGWNQQTAVAWSTHLFSTALQSLLGWLLAAVAAALGAQFWFDLIKRIVNPRGTGSRPASAPAAPDMGLPVPPAGYIADNSTPPALP